MYKALYLSPMIPSFNLNETAGFFRDVLAFSAQMHTPEYAIYHKDHFAVHLLNAGEGIGQIELYLEVDDVDALWDAIKDKLSGLTVRAPFNREYGMREIHIGIPYTHALLFIGQAIRDV